MIREVRILYVDDEAHQHIALECLLPEEWELQCFDSAPEALKAIKEYNPTLVLSDQRMPEMQGFEFLEKVKELVPEAVRVITTGYNDESSIVSSIRKAQIFDYLVKPWDEDKLIKSLERAINHYNILQDKKELDDELKSWVHPFVFYASKKKLEFPQSRSIATLVLDIIGSSSIHDKKNNGWDLREVILGIAWRSVLLKNGQVESQEGDSIYANFGLLDDLDNPADSALQAAQLIQEEIRKYNQKWNQSVSCGIAIHWCPNVNVCLRSVDVLSKQGEKVVKKKFDTRSLDVDLTFRMESVLHSLSGVNVILSPDIIEAFSNDIDSSKLFSFGPLKLKGQIEERNFFIIPYPDLSELELNNFSNSLGESKKKVAS